ncbi:hypothetical protein LP419_12210 [Massilia sp. H-1]|nr:hypothetical protein LP419_12210 [Massilia sp. H-1]
MMIVPNFWAEARTQYRSKGKQITIRRFGWSDASQEDAQNNAQARADEALKRAVSGEPLPRRERKVPYNGADGLPIREEVVARHGETVITRNSYGARCLNTPDVLFADIDFPEGSGSRAVFWACALFLFGASAVVIYLLAAALARAAACCGQRRRSARCWPCRLHRRWRTPSIAGRSVPREDQRRSRAHILRFMETRPNWRVHVYRTL